MVLFQQCKQKRMTFVKVTFIIRNASHSTAQPWILQDDLQVDRSQDQGVWIAVVHNFRTVKKCSQYLLASGACFIKQVTK